MAESRRPKAGPKSRKHVATPARLRRGSGRFPSPTVLEALYGELMAYPNVVGCFLGHKHKKGKSTRRPAIVCLVREKLPLRSIAAKERLPRQVTWRKTSKNRGRLPVDVESLPEPLAYAASAGPGDAIRGFTVPGGGSIPELGTVGIAIQHPQFGGVITTAGHVIRAGTGEVVEFPAGSRPRVSLANAGGPESGKAFTGDAVKRVRTRRADYALILPAAPMLPENLFQDAVRLSGPVIPTPADIGSRRLFVLTAAGARKTVFMGLAGTVPIGEGRMDGLLLTTNVTEGGDSGSALVDDHGNTWGLLVGWTTVASQPYSAFMPATVPLSDEHATFI